ncbi:MAG: hypothetical protein ACPG31_08975 [Planctomycetota bacterium]
MLAVLALAVSPQVSAQDWVLQDLLMPTAPTGVDRAFLQGYGLGDLSGNGLMSYLVSYGSERESIQGPWTRNSTDFFMGMGSSNFSTYDYDIVGSSFTPSGNWKEPESCFLIAPGGLILAAESDHRTTVNFFDVDSRTFLGEVVPPAAHPAFGPIIQWAGLLPAGDVNHDGFDDIFFQGYAANNVRVMGMIDGQTRTVPWTHYEPFAQNDFAPSRHLELDPRGDLNGDGSSDFVATFYTYDLFAGQFIGFQVALNGLTGGLLWENKFLDSATYGSNLGGRDANGDGVHDFLFASWDLISSQSTVNDRLVMSSGLDGSTIWETNWRVVEQLFPGDYCHPDKFSFFLPDLTGSSPFLVASVFEIDSPTPGVPSRYGTALFHGDSGAFIDFVEFPNDLEPWFPDSSNSDWAVQFFTPLGDIDRDGFAELFHCAPLPNFGDNLNTATVPTAGLIYSQCTLTIPDTVAPGSILQADVLIPSGAGRPCTLLLSTAFDNTGGLVLGENWRLHLAPSPLLTMSLANRPFSTTLDPNGEGNIQLTIPNNPGLIGTAIYARAVIQETVGSPEIWTVTTLAVSEIQ